MLAKVHTAAVVGLEGEVFEIEVDASRGMSFFVIAGQPDKAVLVKQAARYANGFVLMASEVVHPIFLGAQYLPDKLKQVRRSAVKNADLVSSRSWHLRI